MHIDVSFAAFDRLAISRGALLAGGSLILALTLGAPSQALAACGGTTAPTGTHAPSGNGGTHTGATTPHGSSSGTSCSSTATTNPTPLAGVHEPGEAPKHASLSGVHTWTHSTTNTGEHSQVHKTTTGSAIKS
jgi:hypothetical protein